MTKESLKLYRISQDENNEYDTYDSAVVVAENEEDARHTQLQSSYDYCWAAPKYVKVEYIGEAKEDLPKGVVCASFNAG